MTPTTSAARPPACVARLAGDSEIRSPKITMPSRIPATGSPAVIVGSEACSGPALNALCISRIPTAPVATRQYADQLCSSPDIP